MDHFDLPDEARHARIENRSLLRSASLPPQHAQHRRALGTPALRAGLRREEELLLWLPSIYEPVCAQKPRPHWLDMLGYYLPPLSGLVPRQSKGLTRTFEYISFPARFRASAQD